MRSRMEFELDNSKFAQVRQFGVNFQKIHNLKKFEGPHRFLPNSIPKVLDWYIIFVCSFRTIAQVLRKLQLPPRDKIFEYTVSLPSLPSIRNSIPLCQKVDSRIFRKKTESLLTVYSGILTECLVYGWYTLEYFTKGTESLLTVYSDILTECLVYGWYTLEYFRKSGESLPMVYF